MSTRKRDKTINMESLKTLVIAFGPREAARQANINVNTVLSLARRKGWKRAQPSVGGVESIVTSTLSTVATNGATPPPESKVTPQGSIEHTCNQEPPEVLANALRNLKTRSVHGLSTYCARAAEELNKLEGIALVGVAGKAKEIADVHRSMWPHEVQRSDILQVAILIQPAAAAPARELKDVSAHTPADDAQTLEA